MVPGGCQSTVFNRTKFGQKPATKREPAEPSGKFANPRPPRQLFNWPPVFRPC